MSYIYVTFLFKKLQICKVERDLYGCSRVMEGFFFCIDRGGRALVSSILLGIKPFYGIINCLINESVS